MCHAYNKKLEKTDNGRNRTTKSIKNQNAQRKGNLQVFGNIGSGHDRLSGQKRRLETKLRSSNVLKRINTWVVPLVRYMGLFFKWMRKELR